MHTDDNLRPELARVEERLRAVEIQLGRLTAQLTGEQTGMAQGLDHLRRVCESHARILMGPNGHALLTRVAVLEDAEQSRKWSLRAVWAAMVAVSAKVLHDLLRGGR